MDFSEDRITVIAGEISRYLLNHPDAADTFAGVSRWWLRRIRLEEAIEQVREALDRLVAQGVVVESVLPDGQVLYSRVRE